MTNAIHGVTTWSKHKSQAKTLMMLVNTDKELANLLFFGIQGQDYTLESNMAKDARPLIIECPANPRIAYYEDELAKNGQEKEDYLHNYNKNFKLSKAADFKPNLKKAGITAKMIDEVENGYQKILASPKDVNQVIDGICKRLKKMGYDEALKRLQRQFDTYRKKASR